MTMPANQSLEQPVTLLRCPSCKRAVVTPTKRRATCEHCGYVGEFEFSAPSDEQEVERVALKLAEAHDAIQNPRKDYTVTSYRAGASVDYWNAQARAALSAMQDSGAIGELIECLGEMLDTFDGQPMPQPAQAEREEDAVAAAAALLNRLDAERRARLSKLEKGQCAR